MSNDIIVLVAVVAPTLALTILRINAVMVFLSLCLGAVLVEYVAGNANSMVTWIAPNASPTLLSFLQFGVLLLPVLLTSAFMLFSVHGRMRTLLNILPAAGVGSLGVLLAVPLLPAGARLAVQGGPLWSQLAKLQALIVGVSALVSLLFLWSQRRSLGGHGE